MSKNRNSFDPDLSHMRLAGRWEGFGFGRSGCLYTPENTELQPSDMVWMSLTCNIVRSWQKMMDLEMERRRPKPSGKIIWLEEVLAGARAKVLAAK
jgi:hypothetical protein